MMKLDAPPNTGKIPLDAANTTLLLKLLSHRITYCCESYFHSSNSDEWKPRTKVGYKLLEFWNIFNKNYTNQIVEYIKNFKNPEERVLNDFKTLLPKVHGIWADKVASKVKELESKTEPVKENLEQKESQDNGPKVVVKKKEKTVTKNVDSTVTEKVDLGTGWTTVVNRKKHTTKKPKNVTK